MSEQRYRYENNKNKLMNNLGINSPLPKITFQSWKNTYGDKNFFDNNIFKTKSLSNSTTITPSRDNEKDFLSQNKLSIIKQRKNFTVNVKVNYPALSNQINKRKNFSNFNSTVHVNTNDNYINIDKLNSCLTIKKQKNKTKTFERLINILHKKSIDEKIKNFKNIKFKFNYGLEKKEILNNSNNIIQNIYNNNNIINNDKLIYKNRKLFQEKYFKLNNIFSFSNNHNKHLKDNNKNEKEKEKEKEKYIDKDKDKEKKVILNSSIKNIINNVNNNNIINNKKNKNIKSVGKNETKPIKNIIIENNSNKNLKTENRENSFFFDHGNKLRLSVNNKKKPNKLVNIFSQKKFKIPPKLDPITKLDNFKIKYESKENVIKKYLSKEICPYIINNNINISKSLNLSIDKLYYTVNKMYRNQLPEYMKHRINWEYIDTKKINLQEQKNININFEWKYMSNRLNFKKYRYEPDSNISSRKYRMVNLFERNYEIGNKRNMFINLISYCDEIKLNVFDYVPFTITINYSKDIEKFLDALKEIMNFINLKKNNNNQKNLITNRKYNEQFWFDKNYEYLENQYIYINKNFLSNKNYWIIKPPDLYQGKCIEISNNFDEIKQKCKNMFKGVDKTFIPDNEVNLEEDDSEDEKTNNNTNINNSIDNNNIYNYYNFNNNLYNNLNINMNSSGSDIELKSDGNVLNNSTENINNSNIIYNKNKKKEKKKVYSRITCFNEIIIQKYLDNPLLYKKRKFDIRCYVLVDSNLNVYFCREGHLKGSSELYDINTTNKFIHITNHSLQKKSSKFEQYEYGNEMSYEDFKLFMKDENIPLENFNNMIEQMKFLVKISFKSVGSKLLRVTPVLCFEIFGYDFILDNDFCPWILEINNNPGLGISSPVIQKLVPRMIDDALRLTIDKVFETKYSDECINEEGKYKSKYKLEGFTDEENIFEFLCNVG